MSAVVELSADAAELMRKAALFKSMSPGIQRYEIDRRVARCEDALEGLRVEWRRCKSGSAGIRAEVDSLFDAATALKNHIAHLRSCRP